jgi:hypothetical protein
MDWSESSATHVRRVRNLIVVRATGPHSNPNTLLGPRNPVRLLVNAAMCHFPEFSAEGL